MPATRSFPHYSALALGCALAGCAFNPNAPKVTGSGGSSPLRPRRRTGLRGLVRLRRFGLGGRKLQQQLLLEIQMEPGDVGAQSGRRRDRHDRQLGTARPLRRADLPARGRRCRSPCRPCASDRAPPSRRCARRKAIPVFLCISPRAGG